MSHHCVCFLKGLSPEYNVDLMAFASLGFGMALFHVNLLAYHLHIRGPRHCLCLSQEDEAGTPNPEDASGLPERV